MGNIQINSKFADKNGEVMIIDLSGHVDQSNSGQLQKTFDDIIDSNVFKIVVNFNDLHYMSSAGWGIFVGEVKRFRENGGDIKLAAMNPEINDVFQMLEFYHILDDYANVEEASAAFKTEDDVLDIISEKEGIKDLPDMKTKVDSDSEEIDLTDDGLKDDDESKENVKDKADVIEMIPTVSSGSSTGKSKIAFNPIKTDVKLADLPIAEKVKKVISENPIVTLFQIRKIISHEHFGNTKIGVFKLWKLLRELDLNSKEKRFRFYRSC